MLKLLSSSNIVALGNKVKLEAIDGLPPYTYSLSNNGDGGFVDANGFYTAPLSNNKGYQVIIVKDADGKKATFKISILSQLQLVCEIIQTCMGLDPKQVYIYNQKINIPPDNKLYIAVGFSNIKVIGSNKKYSDGANDALTETSCVSSQGVLKIDILSRGYDALNRKEEVISSLTSTFSNRIQTANSFKLARIPTAFNDLSQQEGSAIPFRFNINVNMHYMTRTTKLVDSFDGATAMLDLNEVVIDGAILDNSSARS